MPQDDVQVNFREFTLARITGLLLEIGFITSREELSYARKNDLFKYVGTSNGAAQYLVGFDDDNDEGKFYASKVFVTIKNGKLDADYGGMPVFETESEEELAAYIEKTCN